MGGRLPQGSVDPRRSRRRMMVAYPVLIGLLAVEASGLLDLRPTWLDGLLLTLAAGAAVARWAIEGHVARRLPTPCPAADAHRPSLALQGALIGSFAALYAAARLADSPLASAALGVLLVVEAIVALPRMFMQARWMSVHGDLPHPFCAPSVEARGRVKWAQIPAVVVLMAAALLWLGGVLSLVQAAGIATATAALAVLAAFVLVWTLPRARLVGLYARIDRATGVIELPPEPAAPGPPRTPGADDGGSAG